MKAMNPKVIQFLQKAKESEIQARNTHLISLGLIDDAKTTKQVCLQSLPGAKYDSETKEYCLFKYSAIEVTDEEYAEICKYSHCTYNASSLEKNVATIRNIMVFFTWLWAIGVVLWVIIFVILPL